MNNQWTTPIVKLMFWSGSNWMKYGKTFGKSTLRMNHDQLILSSDNKIILESFNMNSKIRGIFKDDVLIIAISMPGQGIRKIRFQLKENIEQCLHSLGEHFAIVNYNNLQQKNTMTGKYRDINEIFKHALENKDPGILAPLPHDYGNFIKLCLLDPAFPQCVSETMKILEDEVLK